MFFFYYFHRCGLLSLLHCAKTSLCSVRSDLQLNEFISFDRCFLIIITYSDNICKKFCLIFVCLFVPLPLSLSQCQQYREQASVLENQPAGTFVLQVHAVDADEGANGKVKYGLMHRDSAMPAFRIHPDSGREVMDCQGQNKTQLYIKPQVFCR